jgi:hypothetical protein
MRQERSLAIAATHTRWESWWAKSPRNNVIISWGPVPVEHGKKAALQSLVPSHHSAYSIQGAE